ncbi:MAG: Rpn family recombination-promoting nuclease/putative transposase [Microscillaceae bacterium]|nr:Rpn family recombination-promoting nuclease/putative transposase [Microscillaceae bacterium]
MNDRFINLFTDYGFKKIFGEEPNKDLLIDFLNKLFQGAERIKDLTYLNNERLGRNSLDRKAVFDLYCENEAGEKFIVEVQRVEQEFFKDRSLYYATFAIQDQASKGKEWKYELKGVYTIGILDFIFDSSKKDSFHHHVQLLETQTKQVFYHKLTFIYLEIPKFDKLLDELQNDYERWLFAFKNLHKLADRPKQLEVGIFKRLLELCEIPTMNPKEYAVYQDSLKEYWDLKSAMDTYFGKGKMEGKMEMALEMIQNQEPLEKIIQYTKLSSEIIEEIRKKNQIM